MKVNYRNTRKAWPRDEHDFYTEPRWCVDALFDRLEIPAGEMIWDPACGTGTILISAREHGLIPVGSDLVQRSGHCGWTDDFLNPMRHVEPDNIVTNPPFKHAIEFIEQGLKLAQRRVVALVRLAFLESDGRMRFFESTPLAQVLVMGPRISCPPGHLKTDQDATGGAAAFCWMIWDKQRPRHAEPTIGWLRRP